MIRLEQVTPRSKSDEVARSIATAIVDRQLRPGDTFASENELAQHYVVSRPNIRQALQRLASAGLVNTRHGVGTFVCPPERWNLFDPLLLEAFSGGGNLGTISGELVELRKMVEVESARLAATRITPEELKALGQWLDQMNVCRENVGGITQADLSFHEVIIEASRNRFFRGIMTYLHEPLSHARYSTMEAGGSQGRKRACLHHEQILNALGARDSDAAGEAMGIHMTQLEADMRDALGRASQPARRVPNPLSR